MRPIFLRMAAFGPFGGVEEIDFTTLGDNPLFLINGPTGSGKSTILDAICFALYGETTGNEREAKEMRCDHADPATLTEVSLTFKLASGCYRITRIPDQHRPKARGEGYTEQKARAELYKVEDSQETLIVAPKVTEATTEIINLTGLSAEQFRQVMVLPQGKFRDLLLAKSEEREAIFQQLFQTHVYSSLQNSLRDQANVLSGQIKAVQVQQNALLEAHELENHEQLQAEMLALQEQLKVQTQKKQQAEENLKQVQAAQQQALQLSKDFLQQAQANTHSIELQAKNAEVEQQKTRLDKAKKAWEIAPLFQETEKQKIALEKAQNLTRASQHDVKNAEKLLQTLEADKLQLPEKQKTLEQLNATVLELQSYRQRSQQLQIAQQNLQRADKDSIASLAMLAKQQQKLTAAKKLLQQAEATQQTQKIAVAGLADKQAQLDKLTEQGQSLRKIADLQTSLDKHNDEIVSLKLVETQAAEIHQQKCRDNEIYEQAWRKGQAAILATHLRDNEPCPVCGSIDHPAVVCSSEQLPTELELNNIRQAAETARSNLEKITRQRLLKEEESKNLSNSLTEEKLKKINASALTLLTLEDIRVQYQQLRNATDALQKIAEALPQLENTLNEHKKNLQVLEQALAEAQIAASEKANILAAAKTDVVNKEAELPEKYRQTQTLEDAITQNIAERDKLSNTIQMLNQRYLQARETNVSAETTLKSSQENQTNFEAHYRDSTAAWQTALQQSVFDSEQAFNSASMEKDAEQQIAESIRQYEDARLLAFKQLEEKTALIANKTRPDLAQVNNNESQATTEKNHIDAQYHRIQQRQHALKTAQDKLQKILIKQTQLEYEYGIIGKLSDVSNGKNPHNLSLQRFVLSVLLDDVLTEASYRLHKMSKGRYQLYRKETVGDKRSKAGLELEVEDAYTGKQRPAATLSGGESFIAALALALGLSDVVQAYAGGIRLDMLFIDEGFGSLDPESLELAINTLLDLRASGRMIGVISHVEEMKRIIDIRLDVIADREASYTRLVGI